MSNSPHWRLECLCPACGQGKVVCWYHSKSSCCSNNGWMMINEDCDIFCDECEKQNNSKGTPSFILYWRFKCGSHTTPDGYKEADKEYLSSAIGSMMTNNRIPTETLFKMIEIIRKTVL